MPYFRKLDSQWAKIFQSQKVKDQNFKIASNMFVAIELKIFKPLGSEQNSKASITPFIKKIALKSHYGLISEKCVKI
jgi:hypothetical protein